MAWAACTERSKNLHEYLSVSLQRQNFHFNWEEHWSFVVIPPANSNNVAKIVCSVPFDDYGVRPATQQEFSVQIVSKDADHAEIPELCSYCNTNEEVEGELLRLTGLNLKKNVSVF